MRACVPCVAPCAPCAGVPVGWGGVGALRAGKGVGRGGGGQIGGWEVGGLQPD